MVQLEQRRHQDLTGQKAEHQHVMQLYAAEQEAVREELRKELAQLHLDKFRALAAELSQVHQVNKKPNVVKNGIFFLIKLRLFSYGLKNYRNAIMTIFLISEFFVTCFSCSITFPF